MWLSKQKDFSGLMKKSHLLNEIIKRLGPLEGIGPTQGFTIIKKDGEKVTSDILCKKVHPGLERRLSA